MRDPSRIERILSLVGDLWKLVPDMRFGQLLENYIFDRQGSLFRQEDDFTEEKLLEALGAARRTKTHAVT